MWHERLTVNDPPRSSEPHLAISYGSKSPPVTVQTFLKFVLFDLFGNDAGNRPVPDLIGLAGPPPFPIRRFDAVDQECERVAAGGF